MSTITTDDATEIYDKDRGSGPVGTSETDFTEDLKKVDGSSLVLHGEDDQIVPVRDAAVKSARIVADVREVYYAGAPQGLTATHQDRCDADLFPFFQS